VRDIHKHIKIIFVQLDLLSLKNVRVLRYYYEYMEAMKKMIQKKTFYFNFKFFF